jgi:PleD family two-component response regulator
MSGLMLVSEDKELAKKLKDCLQGTEARLVAICDTAQGATESFQQTRPTLVVLETFLPGSSGLDVLKNLKRMDEHCVYILLSRLRTRGTVERAFRMGAHDVLMFPLDYEVVRQTILHRLEAHVPQAAE